MAEFILGIVILAIENKSLVKELPNKIDIRVRMYFFFFSISYDIFLRATDPL